jgi:DNA-binding winged helix-turn-helix (wHTH) protein
MVGIGNVLAFGEFVFDPARRQLHKGGVVVKVDPLQLDLLACFLSAPGVLLSKQALLDRVWDGRSMADSALSVAITKLRKVLGDSANAREYIETRYGRGYRFVLPVQPLAPEPPPAAPSVPRVPQSGAPLVGRVDCLQQLETALDRSVEGSGRMTALLGEPGIGKTRLAETLEYSARARGLRTTWGRFFASDTAPPLWPLAQVLRSLNRDGIADDALQRLSEHSAKAELQSQPRQPQHPFEHGTELSPGLMFGATTAMYRTLDEISQALFRLSQQAPLVILLDDLQWADAMSLRVLNYLVGEIDRWRIFLLATCRSVELAENTPRNRELLRLLAQHRCARIELQRLHETDVDEYISASFNASDGELTRAVFTRSGGNPFFMIELLRPWLGKSLPQPSQLRVSGLALDMVRQRLHALPQRAREVLSAAAVIGHDFHLGLLSQIADREADELLEALDGSLSNDTVVASSYVPGAYAFGHELIREALYSDLAASERCRLHLRAAEALQRRRDAGVEVACVELAQHLLAALPQGSVANAIAHARAAAMTATRMAAHADARNLLQRAFDALKFWAAPDPETLTALLLELAMVERVLGDSGYIERLTRAVALAREQRQGTLLLTAAQMLSLSPGLLARPEANSVLEAALEVLPAEDLKRRAIALAHLAWTPPSCLSARKVNALLAEAETLARDSGDAVALAVVRDARLFFSAGPATHAQGEALADEIERDQRANPQTARKIRILTTGTLRYILAMQRGDELSMGRAIEQRERTLATLNNCELDWHHDRLLLVGKLNRGEFRGLAAELERLRQRSQKLRLQSWRVLWVRDYGELLLWTGDITEFANRLRSSLALLDHESPTTMSRKLRAMVDFGFTDDARIALAKLPVAVLEDLPQDRDYLEVLCQLAGVSAAAGSREHCTALYEQLQPYPHMYAMGISFHCDGSVSHHLGALARALGRSEVARSHFEMAIERNLQLRLAPRAVQSQFALATLLLDDPAVRDVSRARQLLAEARDAALQLGLSALPQAIARRLAS